VPDASEVPFPVEVQHVVEYYAVRAWASSATVPRRRARAPRRTMRRLRTLALAALMKSFPSRPSPAEMRAAAQGTMGCARAFVRAGVSCRGEKRSRVQL